MTEMHPYYAGIVAAANVFAEEFDQYVVADIGPALNCGEAEALDALLRSVGHGDTADVLMEAHSNSDDSGDRHYTGTGGEHPPYVLPGERMLER